MVLTRAEAQHPIVHLEVVRNPEASSCLDAPHLMRKVSARLKRKVFHAQGEQDLEVSVSFEREGTRWTSRVELSDKKGALGRREISTEARHCSAIDDSLALVVALMVDTPPTRPQPEVPVTSAAPVATPSESSTASGPGPTAIELPADTLAPRESFRFDVRACSAFAVGVLPGVAPGVELGIGAKAARGPWLRMTADFFAPKERGLSGQAAGVRLSATRIGVEVCTPSTRVAFADAELCLAQKVGSVHAIGFGFDRNSDESRIHYALGLGGNAVVALTRGLGIGFGLHGEIPFTRDHFTARSNGLDAVSLFRTPPLAMVLRIGLRAEL